jgi:plasmid stability protein
MAGENWTFWLMMTNYALAMITVLALSLVFVAVCWDLIVLKVRKARTMDSIDSELRATLHAGSHSLSVPELGLTMADGGERLEPSESEGSDEKSQR